MTFAAKQLADKFFARTMQPENILAIIAKLKGTKKRKGELGWKVVDEKGGEDLEITSIPKQRVHIIHLPGLSAKDRRVTPIKYLHELGHAWLAENVDPVFAAWHFLCPGRDFEDVRPTIYTPLVAAGDWFVDDVIMQWAPVSESAEMAEHLREMLEIAATCYKMELLIRVAFALAQGVQYLEEKPQIPKKFASLVTKFLSVPPGEPSPGNFSLLFNGLLDPFSKLRAHWDSGQGEWVVK